MDYNEHPREDVPEAGDLLQRLWVLLHEQG
jgi:hypothetical protein